SAGLSTSRVSVEVRVGWRPVARSGPAVAVSLARYAIGGPDDLRVLSDDLAALSSIFPGCSICLAGLSAAIMSRGLAYDSEDGLAAAAEFCRLALEASAGGIVTADHPSPEVVRWIAAASIGVDP